MRRSSWSFLLLLGGALLAGIAIIALYERGEVFGLASMDFVRLTVLLAVLISAVAVVMAQGQFAKAVRQSFAWVMIGLVLIGGYTFRSDLEWGARRMWSQLAPGALVVDRNSNGAIDAVVVTRGFGGQFLLDSSVNDASVRMLVDTGASIVTLSYEDAVAAGFAEEDLNFRIPVMTANGPTRAAPVIIEQLTVGPIIEQRLPALVARKGALEVSLLGMNFLNRLKNFSFSRDQMVLTP